MADMSAGQAVGAFGKILGSIASTRQELGRAGQLRYGAGQAQINAALAQQDMENMAIAGTEERSALSAQEQQVIGAGRAAFAGGNVAVGEGTPLEFEMAQAEQFAAEKSRSRREQSIGIGRLDLERRSLLSSANMQRRASRSTRTGAYIGQVAGLADAGAGALG